MADPTKKLDGTGLSQVWAHIVELFATKTALSTAISGVEDKITPIKTKLDTIEEGAQVNVLEGVKVNGEALTAVEKVVNILVPTGALASLDEVAMENLTSDLQAVINGKADAATTLAGYGITDAYTTDQVDEIINGIKADIAAVYIVKGSVNFVDLPTEEVKAGYAYNIKDTFTVDNRFTDYVEGADAQVSYPAGTNIVFTVDGKWDAMAGTYDFSAFAMKSELPVALTKDEIDAICVLPTEAE